MRTRLPQDRRGLVLAVSGGADSLSLLSFVAETRKRLALGPILVATVDHGLRPESAGEARFVAAVAARAGFAHRTLSWRPDSRSGNLSAQARDARYRLLGDAARETGAGCVVTAHHEDDQIETHLIARERGEGASRQAGMRPCRDLEPGLCLFRPLLGVSKARLLASLRVRGLDWIEDPTNQDKRYARARLRMTPLSAADRARALSAIRKAAAIRDAIEAELACLLQNVRVAADGSIGFETVRLDGEAPIAEALLSRVLRAAGGASPAALGSQIRRLLAALRASPHVASTLGGCLVEREDGHVRLMREYGREGPAGIAVGFGVTCFDDRFDIDPSSHSASRIVPLGHFGRGGAAHRTLPVLLDAAHRPIAAHPALLARLPEHVTALRVRERVTWRLYRDLAPRLQNAAKAPPPVGKDFAADYLSGKSTKRVRAGDPVAVPETQSQDG